MIHFEEGDFSERHSEEVISFFWRSVYIHYTHIATLPWHEQIYWNYIDRQFRQHLIICSITNLWKYMESYKFGIYNGI